MVTGRPCTQVFEIEEWLSCSVYIPEFIPSLLILDIYFTYMRETCIRIWYLLPLILLKSLQSSGYLTKSEFLWPCSEHGGKDLDQRSIDTLWWHT